MQAGRSRTLRPLPLLALAAACGGALVLAYLLLVRTFHGQRVDEAALVGRDFASARAESAANALLTTIGVGSLALATAVLVAQALLRRRVAQALLAATVIGGALLATEALKHVLLTRPDLAAGWLGGGGRDNSFPSGHATIAFAVGVAATLVVPARMRRTVAIAAVAYGAAVGIAVVAAGWHRPSDVAGAFLVVAGWAAATALAFVAVAPGTFAERQDAWPRASVARGYLLLGGAVLLGGYVAAVAVVAAGRAGRIEWTAFDGAFVASCAGLAALAAVLMAALLTALRESLPPRRRVHARRAPVPRGPQPVSRRS